MRGLSMRRPDLTCTSNYIAWYARRTPGAMAVIEAGMQISYLTLAADLCSCVQMLVDRAVKPGLLVGIAMPGRYQTLLLLLSCEVIGATSICLTSDELVVDDPISGQCDFILSCYSTGVHLAARTILVGVDWPTDKAPSPVPGRDMVLLDRVVAPGQVMRIIKTSGTTGQPKTMPLLNSSQQLRIASMIARVAKDVLPVPRFLCLYGIAVNGVCMRVFGALQFGGTVVFASEPHAGALIDSGAVNYAHVVVGDCERIVKAARRPPDGHVLHVEVFGAAVSVQLRELIRQRFGDHITINYSSNEMSSIATVNADNVGALCPGVEARIVDEDGTDLPFGEIGRIRVRSRTMVLSYFNDPVLSAASFINGWFQTGDLGSMPGSGLLAVVGREDDMLNIGGVKLARLPLEARIGLLDGVQEAVVMSVADGNGIGVLLVAIEINGEQMPDLLLQQVKGMLATYVRSFEVLPMRWFPRSESGKVRRPAIEVAFRHRLLD
jgi:acyl-coenzyme A synthetase/AMP-(fatty) acid ligase